MSEDLLDTQPLQLHALQGGNLPEVQGDRKGR